MDSFFRLTQIEFLEHSLLGAVKGSNDWVVSGEHTRSGKPLLANDPHLDVVAPCFWYPAELLF
jgi:penicillin amidase